MLERLRTLLEQFDGEEGQGLAEYSLIIVFVAAVCVAALSVLGMIIPGPFNDVAGVF